MRVLDITDTRGAASADAQSGLLSASSTVEFTAGRKSGKTKANNRLTTSLCGGSPPALYF